MLREIYALGIGWILIADEMEEMEELAIYLRGLLATRHLEETEKQQSDQQQQGEQQQQGDQQEPDDQDIEIDSDLIDRQLGKHLQLKVSSVTTRQEILEAVRALRAWVQIDLARAFHLPVRKVPEAVADYFGLTTEKAETSQPEQDEKEKNSEN